MTEQEATVQEEVAPEQEAPEAEEVEEQEPASQESDGEVSEQETETEGDGEQDEQEPEYDEFDFGGNKLQLPKGSVPDELRDKIESFTKGTWGDYTRKNQELAEQKSRIEARAAAVEKLESLNGEALDKYSRGLAIRQEIEQLQGMNTEQLWQSNPDRARRISDAISRKSAEFNNIVQEVSKIEGELSKAQEAEVSRRLEEGKREVERRIPGFSEKYAPQVVDYAVKSGIPEKDAGKWAANPIVTEMAYKAMLYDRLQEQASKTAKPKPAQAQPVATGKTKGGGKPRLDLVRDADKMSPEEWARRRNAELAKRAS